MGHYACDMRPEWFEPEKTPVEEKPLSHIDENWQALPQRLRGRGDFLREYAEMQREAGVFRGRMEVARG